MVSLFLLFILENILTKFTNMLAGLKSMFNSSNILLVKNFVSAYYMRFMCQGYTLYLFPDIKIYFISLTHKYIKR